MAASKVGKRKAKTPQLTHLDARARPRMVDVSAKRVTARSAVAECWVDFPPAAAAALQGAGMRSKKGPVIDTAIVAGTLAIKRTHELVPFCHALPIEGSRIEAEFVEGCRLRIICSVRVRARTGVEMEALVGASVAALTIYDMCKSLSHGLVIRDLRLLQKTGGSRGDWKVPRG